MIKQDHIAIQPGGLLKMVPGGSHVMLIKPKQPVRVGDKIDLKFRFGWNGSTFMLCVFRKQTDEAGHGYKHHKMN